MKAWTIDADDFHLGDDLNESLLHRTQFIDEFLSQGHDDKFIVVGTKGLGKTLLLKAKRVLLQRGTVACIPENHLLEKPGGDKVFSKDMLALFSGGTDPWAKVWLISIASAVLKRVSRAHGMDVVPRLRRLLDDAGVHTVLDHLSEVLDFTRADLFAAANDVQRRLIPQLREINSPLALFIDGVDEYFNKHVQLAPTRASVTGEVSPGVWYFSQIGLVEIAYQLRRINHHIRVFAAVRKEAFLKLAGMTSMVQQYHGSAIDLTYSARSLRQIFINNVRLEKPRNLVEPSRANRDPLCAFLGRSKVKHTYTREDEDAFDYILRHTLRRPRDLMTIGRKLSDLAPEDRADLTRFKEAVNQGASDVAYGYLKEIPPYIGVLDLDRMLSRLPSNVLTGDQVNDLFQRYNERGDGGPAMHVFCRLYKAGLIGHVEMARLQDRRRQKFLAPGERTFDPDGTLPPSSHYLVHPVLVEVASRLNPALGTRIDRLNIVGDERPWREAWDLPVEQDGKRLCVLKADVVEFSSLMARRMDGPVLATLDDLRERLSESCICFEVAEGDSLTVVDHDPDRLLRTARRIAEALGGVPGSPRLRMAVDRDVVRLTRTKEGRVSVRGGRPLRTTARIQPHVHPGQTWVTEQFRKALNKQPTGFVLTPVSPADDHGPQGQVPFNVKKPGSREADMLVLLYRVESP
jgi:class 3 adenylate cyclase